MLGPLCWLRPRRDAGDGVGDPAFVDTLCDDVGGWPLDCRRGVVRARRDANDGLPSRWGHTYGTVIEQAFAW
eukprot:6488244-Pyramimonas_sp.AAC.1